MPAASRVVSSATVRSALRIVLRRWLNAVATSRPSRRSSSIAGLALQGPLSCTVLKAMDLDGMLDSLRSIPKGDIVLLHTCCHNPTGIDPDERARLRRHAAQHPIAQARPDQRPAVVQHVVNFGRDRSLLLAVKCGEHAAAGTSSCDKGLQIDLSQLRNARVDRAAKTARIAGGSLLGELDYEAMAHGLVTTAGTVSHTGVGGLTLGGGFGRLGRRFGMSIDNVLEMDIVTPDGKLRRVGPQDDADLYWALRGGGGNFGVVTRFEYRLHPVGPGVLSGLIVLPLTEGSGALRKYREFAAGLPEETSVWVVLRKAPPLPFLPDNSSGTRP